MRVLFAASEAYPLIKTGGLGDVAGSLPPALARQRIDVRLVLPAYGDVLSRLESMRFVTEQNINGEWVRILHTRLPGSRTQVWLVDHPLFSARLGNPYLAKDGKPWPDNGERYLLFCQVAALIAQNEIGLDWQADLVHANDWQTGLIPAFLKARKSRVPSLFTIHNLAYQGNFGYDLFGKSGLPAEFWSHDGVEFYDHFSFMKAALFYAQVISTVSPTYAREIQTPEFGCGLDGLLRHRQQDLHGVLNGIDRHEWNPASDKHLPAKYRRDRLAGKTRDKAALQKELKLKHVPEALLVGMVGRLVEQKGVDVVLKALPELLKRNVQVAVLGSGETESEAAFAQAALQNRGRVAFHKGYNEGLAHRIEAGADVFLMPSRFEPCGLNQLYSLRYGTLPVVHGVGGLADTVIHASETNIAAGTATGIVMEELDAPAITEAIDHALKLHADSRAWKQVVQTAMAQDYSWTRSAEHYLALYEGALAVST
ncbi:MAG: glycogen synthase GlgA [Thiobacillaceae bacterium]|jgi:starch synthase